MELRIYYEDTDAAGVVYHANYLKYFERARTEYFREHGLFVAELAAAGFVFPVVKMEIVFSSPARHDDLLEVTTIPSRTGGSSFCMHQQITRKHDGKLLVDALVTLACVSPELKACRIPIDVRQVLSREISAGAV
jgi:acyl-CoA thioester hydrolase